ncbi:hypothetical protein FSO04_37235 [Paraburkholderia madseniana]|uniref:Type III secretion protein n=1 Tax=Paraburkholderia madseniana TaxID=2599607 RepID=A0A6N6W2P3_9BURK|nr:hypothetical protein [Paraburkholderia madseniana]KAE8754872.1 hypothetical protein FSO04_37235 [Paraburkholderia madseniana]
MAGQFKRIVEVRRRREQSLQRVLAEMRDARDAQQKELCKAERRIRDQEQGLAAYWSALMKGLGDGLDYQAFQAALVWRETLQARLQAEQQMVPQYVVALEKAEAKVARAADDVKDANRSLRNIEEQYKREREADALLAELLAEAEADEFVETLPPKGRN